MKTGMRRGLVMMVALAGVGLSGCDTVSRAHKDIEANRQEVDALQQEARRPTEQDERVEQIRVVDDVYVGGGARKLPNGAPLPSRVEGGGGGVTILPSNGETGLTLSEIAGEIQAATGLEVRVDLSSPGEDDEAAVPGAADGEEAPRRMRVVHRNRPLSDFLKRVANHFDVTWRYADGVIRFDRYVIRHFQIATLPGALTSEATLSNSSGSEGAGSESGGGLTSAEFDTSYESGDLDFQADVEEAVRSIVSGDSMVRMSNATGTLTVAARAPQMDGVADFVESYNRQRRRQVALHVRVFSVRLSESDEYDFNLSSVLDIGNGDVRVNENGVGVIGGSASSLGFSIVGNGVLESVDGLVTALSRRGDVSVEIDKAVSTMNNLPVPVEDVLTQGFLRSVSSEATDGATSQGLEPGELTTGFSMLLTPRIRANGTVMLRLGITISENLGFESIGDVEGGNGIQVPNFDSQSTVQQVRVPSSATLIMAGFDREESEVNKSGTGSPDVPLPQGERSGSQDRTKLIVAVTPYMYDVDTLEARPAAYSEATASRGDG